MEKSGANSTVHLLWIIAILIALISVLLWRLPNGDSLSGYISFAASIASLVLAVVAIFQSIISSSSFSQSLTEIRNSAKTIVDETARLGHASINLSSEADAALKKLGELPAEMSAMRDYLGERIEKIDVSALMQQDAENVDSSDEVKALDILHGRSYGFVFAIYLMSLSVTKTKSFDIDEIFSGDLLRGLRHYVAGVVASFKYFRMCSVEIDGVPNKFLVNSMGSIDHKSIVDEIDKFEFTKDSLIKARERIQSWAGYEVGDVETTAADNVSVEPAADGS